MLYKVTYVYHHFKLDTGELFYIGKGSLKRAYEKYSRHIHWRNTVLKHGLVVRISATFLTEEEAYIEEEKQINLAFNMGIKLVNKTLGGLQEIPLIETRKKMSEAAHRRAPIPHTPEWNKKVSESLKGRKMFPGHQERLQLAVKLWRDANPDKLSIKRTSAQKLKASKPVYCVNNNTYYLSQTYAADDLGISPGHINQVCKGTRKHTHGYIFKTPTNN